MTQQSNARRGHALLAGLCLALLASSASAVPLHLEITGTVSSADGTGVFEIGEAVGLAIDLDLELPLVLPSAFFAVTSASGSGTVAGDAIALTSGALTSWQISDGFSFRIDGTGPALGNSAFDAVELAPGVFEGADLADFLALDASDVQELRLRVRTTSGSSSSLTRANVNVTGLTVVPEPGTALLVSLGIVGLGLRRRRSGSRAAGVR